MSQSLIAAAGAQPQKQPRFVPIHVSRAQAGLVTNRAALHDPSQYIVERFYGGQPDVLLAGSNIEVSPQLTWKHRPGSSIFGVSGSLYPTAPLTSWEFYNPDGSISVFVDTVTGVYKHNPAGAPTLIFTKSAGAGQTAFLQLGDILYFANGVDNKKYVNGVVYNWASDGPPTVPGVLVNNIGAGATGGVPWTANTVYTTMGFLKDPNSNVQQLVTVNADGSNTANATIGTSGVGQPIWPTTSGSTVTEVSGLIWECFGPISVWAGSTLYQNGGTPGSASSPAFVFDPASGNVFVANIPGGGTGTSGSSRPAFGSVPVGGNTKAEGTGKIRWFNLGKPNVWAPSHTYAQYAAGGNTSWVVSPTTPTLAGTGSSSTAQTVFLQAVTNVGGGTSDSSHTGPKWATTTANPTTQDGQLGYQYLSTATYATNTAVVAWQLGSNQFNVIYDGTNFQVCILSGTTGSVTPSWGTSYGQVITEATGSGVQWVCVGPSIAWAASTKWYLPAGGFQPPVTNVDPYGGSNILDSNGNAEFVTASGKSAGSAPSWPTKIGGTVTESGGLTWTLTALASTIKGVIALPFSFGYGYGYAWKARANSDFYVTNAPNGQQNVLGPPTGAGTGGITTASPIFQMPKGSNPGAQMQVSGAWPTDLQYDTVVVYRSADGFQGGPYLELTEIAAPQPVNGVYPGTWTFYDTILDANLNELIEADVVGENDPPPIGLQNITFHMGRVWGNVGTDVYASSGPDIPPDNGNGNEGFAPANVFPLKSPVSSLKPTQSGLIGFTSSDIYIIAGGPSITQFFPWIIAPTIGVLSPNAVIQVGGEFYLFTADKRLISMSPGGGITHMGFSIADQLATLNPANVYVTEYANGADESSIYIGDGSTGWFKLNPHQAPDNGAVWSPFATIIGGCKMLRSTQTAPGVKTLLIGGTSTNQNILKRDTTVFQDNGSNYSGSFTIGSVVLAHSGELAELGFVTFELANQGNPVFSFLPNEISGTFSQFASFNSDPPLVYGTTGSPSSYYSRRYDFAQTISTGAIPPPLMVKHLQLKVTFPAENFNHELYSFTINGARYAEL